MEVKPDKRTEDSFLQNVTQSQTALRIYIRTLVPAPDAAEDILQETNLDIWHKAATYDPSRPFLPWAKAAAWYQVLKYRQACRRERLIFSSDLVSALGETLAAEPSAPDESALNCRRADALEGCLQRLCDRERAILHARYSGTGGIDQIARDFHTTKPAIVSLLYRLRKSLLRCIQGKLCRLGRRDADD